MLPALPTHALTRWPRQDAKARISEVVRRAHSDGPQHVTLHGRDAVVVVDADEFQRLRGQRTGQLLIDALQASPQQKNRDRAAPLGDAGAGRQAVSGWLLDTHVISGLRKPRANARVRGFVAGQALEELFVSSVTFAAIRYGIELLKDPVHRAELNAWLQHKVRPMFEHRVLEVSEAVMFKWRLLVEDGGKAGHTFSQPDLIIAATALQHGLTVVTRDTGDFKLARVPLLNPWIDETP